MRELIAKRYVKALIESFDKEQIGMLCDSLKKVQQALEIKVFAEIIKSPSISEAKKIELVLDICGRDIPKLVNFIKILGAKNRFEFIPDMCVEIEKTISTIRNEYAAILYVTEFFDEAMLKNIETAFAQKLNVNLVLTQQTVAKEGVRLIVEDLGVEVAFSREKFINDLREHILKAF